MPDIYVAPNGDDSWPGTEDQPFATLDQAVQAAREAVGPVGVHLRAGRHVVDGSLAITTDNVVVQAYGYGTAQQEEVVLSGGRTVTGWRVRDGEWSADVGELDTRQLYIDGHRVERAAVDVLPGAVTSTETGYVTDATLDWRSPGDVEFVYRGVYPWTEARCAVDSTVAAGESTVITMAQPAFARALDLYDFAWEGQSSRGPGLPTRVENDASFLTEPGTFVLDRSRPGNHVLRYLPCPDEDPAHTRVIAPGVETLLRVTGATGVEFRGLVFADATWSRPASEGFLHYHGDGYYDGGPVEKVTVVEDLAWVTVPADASAIPACVRVEDSDRVTFEGCRFTRLGATALGFTGGADHVVRNCEFDTLAACGTTITGSQHVRIEDNRLHRVGLDFPGSPAVTISDTRDCVVTHNHIADTPHCGIVGQPARGTHILHNLVTDTMGVLADGGGIYLAGPQGESAADGARVYGNVVEDTHTPYNFGLYTDYGASWVTVENNAVLRADSTAVLHPAPPLENVVYRGNVWDADPQGSDDVPAHVTYTDNTTITDPAALEAAIHPIRQQAGPRLPR